MSHGNASFTAVAPSPEEAEDHHPERQQRQHGLGSKLGYFPIPIFAAIFGSIVCWILMGVVLYKSHNEDPYDWHPQPSVYLSILSVLSSACLRAAYKRATAIEWWHKVDGLAIDLSEVQDQVDGNSRDEDNLKKADNHWKSAHNFTFAFWSIWFIWSKKKTFSILSLACLIFTILPASSPLLQRASYIGLVPQNGNTTFWIQTRSTLPSDFTGVMNSNRRPSGLTPVFTEIVINLTQNPYTGFLNSSCQGSFCNGTVTGVGLAYECSSDVENSFLDTPSIPATVFNVSFSFLGVNDSLMSMSVVSKGKGTGDAQGPCQFPVKTVTCTFSPAKIGYTVTINDYSIDLNPNTSYKDDQVLDRIQYQPSDWSGIFLYLSNSFKSSATLSCGTELDTKSSGLLALLYAESSTEPVCQQVWEDPTQDLLAAIRQLMFLTAIFPPSGSEDRQPVNVTTIDNYQRIVYQSDYLFLALLMVVSGLSLLSVLVLTRHWKSLNRKVNLSPAAFPQSLNAKRRINAEGEREKLRKGGINRVHKRVRKAINEQFDDFLSN